MKDEREKKLLAKAMVCLYDASFYISKLDFETENDLTQHTNQLLEDAFPTINGLDEILLPIIQAVVKVYFEKMS
jgi:hypothetical protein